MWECRSKVYAKIRFWMFYTTIVSREHGWAYSVRHLILNFWDCLCQIADHFDLVVCVNFLRPSQLFSVMSGRFPVFLGWSCTKQRIKGLAQRHSAESQEQRYGIFARRVYKPLFRINSIFNYHYNHGQYIALVRLIRIIKLGTLIQFIYP